MHIKKERKEEREGRRGYKTWGPQPKCTAWRGPKVSSRETKGKEAFYGSLRAPLDHALSLMPYSLLNKT